jgi:hypothetical protein
VVERILGKAEVDSSILSGGTIFFNDLEEKPHILSGRQKRRGSMGEAAGGEKNRAFVMFFEGAMYLPEP